MSKEDRRVSILETSKRLFAQKGYHATSISKIIEEAKVARGTFYIHFNSKRAVLDEIIDSVLESIIEKLKPILTGPDVDYDSILRQLRINLAHALEPLFNDKFLAKIFVSEAEGLDSDATKKLSLFYKKLIDWVEESLQDGQEEGIVRNCNPRVTAIASIGMLRGIIWSYAVGGEKLDFHEVVEEITAIVAKGIIINRSN